MSWSTTTLSTSATIARHEKEVLAQAGSTARKSIYVPAGTTVKFSTSGYATCTYATFTYSDSSTANVSVVTSEVTLPTAKYIIGIELYTVANVLLYTFPILEGYGSVLTDSTGAKTLTTYTSTGNWTGWANTNTSGDFSWNDKLVLAKQILGYALETELSQRGIWVDELGGDVLLDVVANPDTFLIACDYLALALIYQDLANGGFTELFEAKRKNYRLSYDHEFSEALKRMNLDRGLSGTATEVRVNFTGRLSR